MADLNIEQIEDDDEVFDKNLFELPLRSPPLGDVVGFEPFQIPNEEVEDISPTFGYDEFARNIIVDPLGIVPNTNPLAPKSHGAFVPTTWFLRNSIKGIYDRTVGQFVDLEALVQEAFLISNEDSILKLYEEFEERFLELMEEQTVLYQKIQLVEISERELMGTGLSSIGDARKRETLTEIGIWETKMDEEAGFCVVLTKLATTLINMILNPIPN